MGSVGDLIDLQNDYVLDLHKESGQEFDKFFEYRHLLKKWVQDKVQKNLYTFRDQTFKSVITGNESSKNQTAFMDNFDDSIAGILTQFQ